MGAEVQYELLVELSDVKSGTFHGEHALENVRVCVENRANCPVPRMAKDANQTGE